MILYFFYFYAFIFGTLIGSFANVIIYRLPLGISIVTPRSRCINCQSIIKWYENIPIFSYLFLRGKCRYCKAHISIRYLLVELITGIVSFSLFPSIPTFHTMLHYFFFFCIFVVFLCLFFIDLDHQLLPNSLNLYLMMIFSFYVFAYRSWQDALVGFIVGLGIPALVAWIFYILKGLEGLGGGDIKLFAVLGIYLGPLGVIHNIFASCLLGSVVGGALIIFKKMHSRKPIPFGPFILIVACFQIYFPSESISFFSIFK